MRVTWGIAVRPALLARYSKGDDRCFVAVEAIGNRAVVPFCHSGSGTTAPYPKPRRKQSKLEG